MHASTSPNVAALSSCPCSDDEGDGDGFRRAPPFLPVAFIGRPVLNSSSPCGRATRHATSKSIFPTRIPAHCAHGGAGSPSPDRALPEFAELATRVQRPCCRGSACIADLDMPGPTLHHDCKDIRYEIERERWSFTPPAEDHSPLFDSFSLSLFLMHAGLGHREETIGRKGT